MEGLRPPSCTDVGAEAPLVPLPMERAPTLLFGELDKVHHPWVLLWYAYKCYNAMHMIIFGMNTCRTFVLQSSQDHFKIWPGLWGGNGAYN